MWAQSNWQDTGGVSYVGACLDILSYTHYTPQTAKLPRCFALLRTRQIVLLATTTYLYIYSELQSDKDKCCYKRLGEQTQIEQNKNKTHYVN